MLARTKPKSFKTYASDRVYSGIRTVSADTAAEKRARARKALQRLKRQQREKG